MYYCETGELETCQNSHDLASQLANEARKLLKTLEHVAKLASQLTFVIVDTFDNRGGVHVVVVNCRRVRKSFVK